jgi:hypothetical protein
MKGTPSHPNAGKNIAVDKVRTSDASPEANIDRTPGKNSSIVIAYYFHYTVRCKTCLKIEASARAIIEKNFAAQIADGTLKWMPFNLDDAGGKAFEKEFDISVSTLLLANMENGKHGKFKKLEKVWELIEDPVAFENYVTTELQAFLNS